MEIIKITYNKDLITESLHLKSGNTVLTDAPVDNNGKGETFSPTDLLCASLGACMITIMAILAQKNNIDIKGASIRISKIMLSDPRRIGEILLKVQMPSKPFSEKEKQLLENGAANCPVAKSLHPDIKQSLSFIYPD